MARNTVGPVLLAVTLLWGTGSCQGGQPSARETAGGNLDTGVHGDRVKRSDDANPLESVVAQLSQRLTSLEAELQASRDELSGSTFIRWGRTSCPQNSQMVYSGLVGGSSFTSEGGSANRLCLSLEPELDSINHAGIPHFATLYGAEYQHIGDVHDYDVPCAVCKAAQTTTLMIPGTKTCPAGWLVQYWGHITANAYDFHAAGDYLCVDHSPEGRGSSRNEDGALFYYAVTRCGSLSCPPYTNDQVVTCVVCSQ